MNKQINSINGYSCVQVQVKVQFYDFSVKNFQNVIKVRVTCLRTHFIPHPKILYETPAVCVRAGMCACMWVCMLGFDIPPDPLPQK